MRSVPAIVQTTPNGTHSSVTLTQRRNRVAISRFIRKLFKVRSWIENVTQRFVLHFSNLMIIRSLPKSAAEITTSLSDGVILCTLINQLHPGTIPRIRTNTGAYRYRAMDNINSFLQSCESLGLPRSTLFEPDDLFSNKNFVKIVYCLHDLYSINKKDSSSILKTQV
jgi:hypothetical protein